MKVAIFGLGSIGRRHARCFLEAGATSLVGMDPSTERRSAFALEFGEQVTSIEAEALAQAPDLVVVASPNAFHVEQALAAARGGCSVFVEKPLGVNLAAAEELAAFVEERSIYLHMGSNWKFHPAFVLMKQLIEDGSLGVVTGGQVLAGQWLPDWHPWEDYRRMYAAREDLGGGAIFDTHEIDYLSWLLGPVREFIGFRAHSNVLEIETEDVAAGVMRFASGALVTLLTDYIQRTPRRRYHLSGDKGTLEWDYHSEEVTYCEPGHRMEKRWTVAARNVDDMYVSQARRVLDDIRTGSAPMTGIAQALHVLRIQHAWKSQAKVEFH